MNLKASLMALNSWVRARTPEKLMRAGDDVALLFGDMASTDSFKRASGMAYVTLFSIIPSLAAVFGLISIFVPLLGKSGGWTDSLKRFVLENLAAGTGQQVVGYLEHFLTSINFAKIGLTGFAGFLVTLVLLLRQIEDAFNRIWRVHQRRNLVHRFIFFWTLLTLGGFVSSLAIAAISRVSLARFLPSHGVIPGSAFVLANVVPVLAMVTFFTVLYKIGPNCTVTVKAAIKGALVTTVGLKLAGRFYVIYASMSNYKTLYGALAVLPLFLLWLYIAWIVILFGAVVAWRSQVGLYVPSDHSATTAASLEPSVWLKQSQVRALTPLIVVVCVFEHFRHGSGRGLSGAALARELDLAPSDIAESLAAASAAGFIVARAANGEANPLTTEYFPAYPASQLSLGNLTEGLTAATLAWAKLWQQSSPLKLGALFAAVNSTLNRDLATLSLEDLLSKVEKGQPSRLSRT